MRYSSSSYTLNATREPPTVSAGLRSVMPLTPVVRGPGRLKFREGVLREPPQGLGAQVVNVEVEQAAHVGGEHHRLPVRREARIEDLTELRQPHLLHHPPALRVQHREHGPSLVHRRKDEAPA